MPFALAPRRLLVLAALSAAAAPARATGHCRPGPTVADAAKVELSHAPFKGDADLMQR